MLWRGGSRLCSQPVIYLKKKEKKKITLINVTVDYDTAFRFGAAFSTK